MTQASPHGQSVAFPATPLFHQVQSERTARKSGKVLQRRGIAWGDFLISRGAIKPAGNAPALWTFSRFEGDKSAAYVLATRQSSCITTIVTNPRTSRLFDQHVRSHDQIEDNESWIVSDMFENTGRSHFCQFSYLLSLSLLSGRL